MDISFLRHSFIWLRRIGKCRGFGIQSPNDYRFVRYVINEHWPYYKYDHMGKHDNWLTRKLGKLYFRLANDLQPSYVLNIHDDTTFEEYVRGGFEKCHVLLLELSGGCHQLQKVMKQYHPSMIRMCISDSGVNADVLKCIFQYADEHCCWVIEQIHQSQASLSLWKELLTSDGRYFISYDLYYCGIIMFDQSRAKQHYVINF